MSIRKRGEIWQVRVQPPGQPRIERSLPKGASKRDAQELELRIRQGEVNAALGRTVEPLIADMVARWLNEFAVDQKDYRQAVLRVRIMAHLLNEPMSRMADVAEAVKREGREAGRKPGTINRKLAILRRVGHLTHKVWQLTPVDYGAVVKLMPGEVPRHIYLSPDAVGRLAQATAEYDDVSGDMVLFAAMSGLRRSELWKVRPKHIVDGVLLLDATTKSGKPRVVPLPPQALEIAKRRLPWATTDNVLRKAFEIGRAKIGRKDVHFHDLRHTYASWLVQRGTPTAVVRDLMGHATVATTNRYAHLALASYAAAVQVLPEIRVSGGSAPTGTTES